MMYRSPERSPQDYRDGIFCTVPRPHFLGRALIWLGCFGEHILGLFGLYPSSLSKSVGFVSLSGKLHWFLYLLLSYFYDPGMFIFRWSSNFVEEVVLCCISCLLPFFEQITANIQPPSCLRCTVLRKERLSSQGRQRGYNKLTFIAEIPRYL